MKSSRGRWAQLGGLPGGEAGGPGRPEAEAIRFGEANCLLGGLYKVNKTSLP